MRRFRTNAGLSRKELAERARVSSRTVRTLESGPSRILHGTLRHSLRRGEVYSLAYSYDYRSALPNEGGVAPDNEVLHSAHALLPTMMFAVQFDPVALPKRVRHVRQSTVDGPAEAGADLVVSPFGVVSLSLLPATPGVPGIRWEWE